MTLFPFVVEASHGRIEYAEPLGWDAADQKAFFLIHSVSESDRGPSEVTFNSNKELFGDTLRVVLRATKPPSDIGDRGYSTIVAATAQCVLLNTAQSPAIKFVALQVEGEADYRKYGGTFATARFRNGPKKRLFKDL